MKIRVSVIGNCQARPIAHLLEGMFSNIQVNVIAIVHLLKNEQVNDYMPFFREADFIITQNISDTYPCDFVRTNSLSSEFKDKLIKIHNLFYRGYTPELIYLRLKGGGTLTGPLGDYHHQIIFDDWKSGLSQVQTIANVMSFEKWEMLFANIHQKSINELKERENFLDIKMFDDIEKTLQDERLFFTFNHPCLKLILMLVNKLSVHLELHQDKSFQYSQIKEPLDKFIVPLSGYVTESLSLKFDQTNILYKGVCANESGVFSMAKSYTLKELVDSFFKYYDANSSNIANLLVNR